MDTHVANELISNSYRRASENAEINIDNIVAAVARLNIGILGLRKEIVAFKNENAISSVSKHNSSSLAPAGFNRTAKNGENRTGARYEPRRNFKGDDSPNGTDLSARLSFAERAREVKAANEAAVFKEDYPRDDKSIEDDERPNRSRVSEPLGTYRKSISDVEKSGEGADERPGDAGNTGEAGTSRAAGEKPRELNERGNEAPFSEAGCGPANVPTPRIKRKRISRGVQCASIGRHGRPGRAFLGCFGSSLRARGPARRARGKGAPANKFYVGSGNGAKGAAGMINDESRNAIKEKLKSTWDTKEEKFGRIDGVGKIGGTACGNDGEPRGPCNGETSKGDDSKCRRAKRRLLEALRRASVRKDDSKAGQGGSPHESRNHEGEAAGLGCGGERANGADNSRKVIGRQTDSSDGREIVATASVGRGSDANKIRARLDSCIAELNGIIGDACAIFGNRRNRP